MTQWMNRSGEPTYGDRRAIDRLTLAADAMCSMILHDVLDRDAKSAALALLDKALNAAVQGVAQPQ
jgi:hypothetical protein